LLLVVPIPLIALIASAVVLISGSAVRAAPAFARLRNGDVRVTIGQLIAVKSANAELRRLHIHNLVVVPMSGNCPLHPSMSYLGAELVPAPQITLTPQTIAHGWTVILASERIGRNKVEQAVGRFRHHYVPRCVTSHGSGPGLGHWEPQGRLRQLLVRRLLDLTTE
jgi:hypothetical protein